MEIIFILIPVALIIVAAMALLFFWAVRSGQFDDLEGPAYRILMDDDERPAGTKGGRKKSSGEE
ncbi:MAG: cbb3-type cytochrome oxidase assembly protein CcoS [Gammaproteobacteria bacterium]